MKTTFVFLLILLSVSLLNAGCGTGGHDTSSAGGHAYYCPMHPEVTSDKPGVCPICHMDLVKKSSDDAMTMTDMSGLRLSETKQVLANVATFRVERKPLTRKVKAYSYVDFAEPSRKLITAKFNGRIEKLWVDKTGDIVSKGQALFDVYSPDLVQAQNDYLIALSSDQSVHLVQTGFNGDSRSLVTPARKKLELMGITDGQIRELDSTRNVRFTWTYRSPHGGTVISKNVQEGAYFSEGDNLFETADFTTIWVISEVYESDMSAVKTGRQVRFRADAFPEAEFTGYVTYVYPTIGVESRTVRVRAEFINRNGMLKPQMYGSVEFEQDKGASLVVPETAVLFTGKRQIVWVKTDSQEFRPREILVGIKDNGFYEVLSGLNDGEQVAATGGFLIDSESQLQTGRTTEHRHDNEKMNH